MLSLEDLSSARIAIELCNNYEFKYRPVFSSAIYTESKLKYHWNKIVENKAGIILKELGLIKQLRDKVTSLVMLIGRRISIWAKYHEGIVGLSRDFSINFLNYSFFTSQGTIDNKKAAEELMKGNNLGVKQKYELACLYCLPKHIPDLYRQMSLEEKKQIYDDQSELMLGFMLDPEMGLNQPKLVKFWSYYLIGQIDKLRKEKPLEEYFLQTAVKSGSKAGVECCLEETDVERNEDALVDAALEAVRMITRGSGNCMDDFSSSFSGYLMPNLWVPNYFYVDVLQCLLSKMREGQQVEFLRKCITDTDLSEDSVLEDDEFRITVLACLLDWPYHNCFMSTAKLMWDFLPESSYAQLLLEIRDNIDIREENLLFHEEKSCDYRKIFSEFWCQSPDRFKAYVFSDKEIKDSTGDNVILNEGKELLVKLFALKNFTYEDWKNIQLILCSATDKVKASIISSGEGKDICIGLMMKQRWEVVDGLVSNCIPCKAGEFKRGLCLSREAQPVCIHFVISDKWDAVEFFLKWSSLSAEEIIRLKREIVYSDHGKDACVDLISRDKRFESVEKFIRWCIPSEEEVKAFKREIVFSTNGINKCADLVKRDGLELLIEFVNWTLPSDEEIGKLKRKLISNRGNYICSGLISDYAMEYTYDDRRHPKIGRETKFRGGKWEQVEMLLTWCFSSEEEIREFKKDRLFKESSKEIHFNLIKCNQWAEAETFFAWLGLSPEEVKELKKETIFNFEEENNTLTDLVFSEEDDDVDYDEFSDYGTKQEAIELLLRWYLTDEEAVIEYRDHLKNEKGIDWMCRAPLQNINSALEQLLRDFHEEQREKAK